MASRCVYNDVSSLLQPYPSPGTPKFGEAAVDDPFTVFLGPRAQPSGVHVPTEHVQARLYLSG